VTQDIQPLTTFRNHSVEMIGQLERTQRPVVLTVNGRAAAVLQSPKAYQRLLDLAAQADEGEGIRQGLEDAREGRTRPAAEVFAELRARHDLSR
jgi:prevent-host-death family protein